MASIVKLNAKLDAYTQNPSDRLDLSGMCLGFEGANIAAAFLPQW
jgi:hypothetical protein